MIIQSIELENYRPFYGKQKIDLSVDKEHTVVLIQADNDTGKTSLFQALGFCLYGETTNPRYAKHVNRQSCSEGDGQTSVSMIFDHDDERYEISRIVYFKKTELGDDALVYKDSFSVVKNGKVQSFSEPEDETRFVEYILPREAAQFFFFDGEKIQGYTSNPPKPNIKNAIEMVLGIRELRNARTDLESINTQFQEAVREKLDEQEGQKEEKEVLQKINESNKKDKEKIQSLKDQNEVLNQTIHYLEKELQGKEELEKIITKKKEAEQQKNDAQQRIDDSKNDLRKFNDGDLAVHLILPLLHEYHKTATAESIVGQEFLHAASTLLHEKNCICGKPIDQFAKNHLKEVAKEIRESSMQDLNAISNELIRKFGENEKSEKLIKILELYEKFSEQKKLSQREIDSLGAKLTNETEQLGHIIKNKRDELKRAEDTRAVNESDLKKTEEQYFKNTTEYDSRVQQLAKKSTDKDLQKRQAHQIMCLKLKESFENVITKLVESQKKQIEDLATRVFTMLTNAPQIYQGIKLDEDYRLHIRLKGDLTRPAWEQEASAGQSQIIAHSFISALNAFTAREAPIVIDTPLARLDTIHKDNVIRHYPKIGKQVIILYQPEELDSKSIVSIHRSISSEWIITRDKTGKQMSTIKRSDAV